MTERRNGDPGKSKNPKRDGPKSDVKDAPEDGSTAAAPGPQGTGPSKDAGADAGKPTAGSGKSDPATPDPKQAPASAKKEETKGAAPSSGAAGKQPEPAPGAQRRASAASAAAAGSRTGSATGPATATTDKTGAKAPEGGKTVTAPPAASTSGAATDTRPAAGAGKPTGSGRPDQPTTPRPAAEAGKGGGAPPATPRPTGGGGGGDGGKGDGGRPAGTSPAPRKRRTGRRVLVGLIVILLLIGGLGYLAVWPYYSTAKPWLERLELARLAEILRNPEALVGRDELAARLAALEQQIADQGAGGQAAPDDAAERLSALEASVTETQETARRALDEIETLKQTVASLQRQPAAGDGDAVSTLDSRLTALESKVENLTPAPAGGALAGRVDSNAQQIASLSDEITALDGTVKSLSGKLDATATDVGTVKSGLDRLDGTAATLKETVDSLTGRVTSHESALSSASESIKSTSAGLTEKLGGLAQEVTALKEQVNAGTESDARRQAFALAVTQLGIALNSHHPYEQPLSAVRQLLPDDAASRSALTALEPNASTGVPTLAELRARFPAVASAAARGDPDGSGSVIDDAVAEITSLVSVRRTAGAPPDGRDAAINATEKALDSGDLAGAVAALEPVAGKNETVTGWIADAKARIAAEKALAALGNAAIAALDTGAGQ